jgi:hypothetical protein
MSVRALASWRRIFWMLMTAGNAGAVSRYFQLKAHYPVLRVVLVCVAFVVYRHKVGYWREERPSR